MAFACAEEPLALSDFLPAQFDDEPPSEPDDDVALLSLPHADSDTVAIAATATVVPNALPILLKLTDPTFVRRLADSRET